MKSKKAFVLEDSDIDISPADDDTYDSLLTERRILLNGGEIDENIVEKVAIPLLEFNRDDSEEPIYFYINSYGGSVMDSTFVSDIIEKYQKPLNIICLGYAMSAAFWLLMSGKNNEKVKRFCYPSSAGLLHVGQLAIEGNTDRVHDRLEFNDKIDQNRKEFVLRNSAISEAEYDSHIRKDWFFTSEDMLKYKIVDYIL